MIALGFGVGALIASLPLVLYGWPNERHLRWLILGNMLGSATLVAALVAAAGMWSTN